MLHGPGQLWELSASSTGSSHCAFPRQCSLRWSSTGPSGDLSHAPEALTQRPAKVLRPGTHSRAHPHPHAYLSSVSKAPRLSFPESATDLTRIFTSDSSRATQKQREEGRKMSNHGHKAQTNKQTKSHAYFQTLTT